VNFFILLTFDKHDKTQLLAKFKKILYMGFTATLYFRKFKVAVPYLKYKRLKLKLRVFLAGYSVAILCHENDTNVFTGDWAVF